ncbi:MAG: hypothetical protein PHQ43_02795 [Dehalococcoidales bacterium]|nr:hypothetical protein [Dehalococcoidales bacterium]
MTKEFSPKAIFDERQRKIKWRRAGLELDDEQLSQVPNPQAEVEPTVQAKPKPKRRLGSLWEDRY